MKILTFYSFKGGVGRTALLMHLAIQWADRGRVVAVVDMDLNAPGLSFHPRLAFHENPDYEEYGTSNLLSTFYASRSPDYETFDFFPPSKLLREVRPEEGDKWGSGGRLLALPAGTISLPQSDNYDDITEHRVPSSDDQQDDRHDPERRSLRAFAKLFRKDLEKFKPSGSSRTIDYVLIDCRTGYPDLADLAMGYLADRIVLVSGLNGQNLQGLTLTLDTLRPGRIPPGRFATDAVVVFSPLPAQWHDSSESREAIREGIKRLESARLPLGDQETVETIPPIYTLPYTQHLATSDLPVSRERFLGRMHPYWEAVYDIAAELVPEDVPEDMTFNLKRKVKQLLGLDAFQIIGVQQTVKVLPQGNEVLSSPTVGSFPLAKILSVPKWHWPLAGDKGKIDQWYAKRSVESVEETEWERFLDHLCAFSLEYKEKLAIINNWPELSRFQKDSLLESLSKMKVKLSSLDASNGVKLLRQLAQSQQDWAGLVLADKKSGDQAMLHWPLEGRRVFVAWESFPEYWLWLVETLTESSTKGNASTVDLLRAAMLRETLPPWGRWAALTGLVDVTRDETESVLKLVLNQPLPEFSKTCLDLVRFVHQRCPDSISLVEPVLEHVKRLADKDSSGGIWNNLGNLLCYVLARYDEAEAAYRKALELNAQSAIILGNYANFMCNVRHSHEEAESLYHRALESDPKHANVLGNFASFMCKYRHSDNEAESLYRRALASDPKHAHNLGNFANFMCDVRHSYDEAESLFRRALESDPKHANNLGNFANFMWKVCHSYEEAESLFRRALESDPNDAHTLSNLALFMCDVRHTHDEAESLYRRALESDPKHANNLGNFSWFLLGQGRREEGLVWLEKALKRLTEVDDPTLEAECRFYQYALGPDHERPEALNKLRQLFDKSNFHSPGWDFSNIIDQAQKNGHPEVAWLNRLAQVISANHPTTILEPWPDSK